MASGTKITTTGILYINGAQVENTFTNINKITKKLEGELKKLPIGTQEFIDKANEVKQARARFEEIKNEIAAVSDKVEKTTGFLGFFKNGILKVGDTMREVFTANLFERALDTIISKGKMTVDQLLLIADAMTDVQKTSGMSLNQVKELWDSFDEMDTRTSKLDRLKIAEVGGRLGVPIEEMKSFVQEVDKAYVALGDSFEGGLEGVVDQLGKIKGLFEDTKGMTYAESINRVGSALNTLAAQGTASEGNISQYALRIGALPDALKPAIDKVLGLGAAFEESGIDSQIAASGTSNFLTTAAENIEAFAYSMNMGVAEAKELINTKPEEFLLRFAEGMKNLPADQTAKIFASLKLNSLEVQKVIGAAANKTDDFRKSMKTAGEEMDKMTSLQSEFNQKNNNAPAILEKLKNAWNDIFTSTNVINKFEWLIQLIGSMAGVSNSAGNGIQEFKERLAFLWQIIKVVTAGLLGYQSGLIVTALLTGELTKATIFKTVADKAAALGTYIANAALLVYNVTIGLVTGNINKCRQAMIVFNLATKANPIGLLIGLLTTAAAAFAIYNTQLSESAKRKKALNDLNKKAGEMASEEISNLYYSYKQLTNKNIAEAERVKILNDLQSKYPSYFKNLTTEDFLVGKAAATYRELSSAILASARIEAAKSKLTEMQSDSLPKEAEILNKIGEIKIKLAQAKKMTADKDGYIDNINGLGIEKKDSVIQLLEGQLEYQRKARQSIQKDLEKESSVFIKVINDQNGKVAKLNKDKNKEPEIVIETGIPSNIGAPGKPEKNREAESAAKKAEADRKKALEDQKKDLEESLKAEAEANNRSLEAEIQYRIDKLNLQNDSYEKEIQLANLERSKELNEQRKQQDEILKTIEDLEKKKSEAKSPEAKSNYEKALQNARKLLQTHDQIVEISEDTHQKKIVTIKEKAATVAYQKAVEAEQRLIDKQRQRDEDEITNIESLSEAKAKLKDNEYLKLTDQELRGITNLEDAKTALREAADRKMLRAQMVSLEMQKKQLEDLITDLADGPAKEALLKNLDEISQRITQVKGAITNGQNQDEKKVTEDRKDELSQVDILGFSAQQWSETFDNLDTLKGQMAAASQIFSAMGNAANIYANLQNALGQKELKKYEQIQEKKKKALQKQLNEGYITREEYNKAVEKADKDLANKKAEIEYKQAKAEKIANMFSIMGSTAAAIAAALPDVPLSIIVGALGAVQLGIVAAQPLPERPKFADGGFTGDGFGSPDSTGFKPAGVVHENEWVAPKWMLQEPRTAKVIDYLESVRQGKTKPMAEGGFSQNNTASSNTNSNNAPAPTDAELTNVLTELKDVLKKIKDEGIIAYILKNARNGKDFQEMIDDYNNLRNKNKH